MASRLRRAWLARAAVALAVIAVPLFAVGSAQASVGGSPSSNTNGLHPDIRSADSLGTSDMQVCFSETLSNSSAVLSNFEDMWLVPYDSDGDSEGVASDLFATSIVIDPTNGDCVDMGFATQGGTLDLNQFSIASADAGAVIGTTAGSQPNLADSVTISSSTGNEGTEGKTTAPNLVGSAVASASSNTIAFEFDKNVDAGHVAATGFWYENAEGNFCISTAATAAGDIVTATFPAGPGTGGNASAGCTDNTSNSTASVADAGADRGALALTDRAVGQVDEEVRRINRGRVDRMVEVVIDLR